MTARKVEGKWYVDFWFNHSEGRSERIRKKSPVQSRRGAEEYERQLREELLAGTYGKQREEQVQRVPTLSEFIPRYLVYAENNNKPSTVDTKKAALRRHLIPALGDTPLDRIRFAEVEEFKAAMKRKASGSRPRKEAPTAAAIRKRYGMGPRQISLKSVNNILAILRKLLVVAQEQGVIEHVPRVKLFKVEKPTFDFLTFDEAERLIQATEPGWRTMVLLALRSGLRLGELRALRWSDVDLKVGRLDVRRTVYKGVFGTPKNGRSRRVDLPDSAVRALASHKHLRGPLVFCHEDGALLSPGDCKFPLTRALQRAGISRDEGQIGWHDLRHTYASHLVMRSVPIKHVQEQLGHSTIEMTMRYAHLSPDSKKAAVQVLDEPAPRTVGPHLGNGTSEET